MIYLWQSALLMALIIGIDPGVNGGICWFDGKTTYCEKMPATESDVCQLLKSFGRMDQDVEMYLEEPPLFAGRSIPGSAIGKLMWNCGVIYGAAYVLGFKLHRVRPAIWMKAHSVGTKGERTTTEWKNVLKARAQELHPSMSVTLSNADALLILDAGKRKAIN